MLTNISLENYKSFKDETQIPIKPLTLLCGVNSSGKSSILKSGLMIKQTVERESPYNQLAFNGKYVNNGFWNDVVCSISDHNDIFIIKNTFALTKTISRYANQDTTSFKDLKKIYSEFKGVEKFIIEHTLHIGKRLSDKHLSSYIESNEVLFVNIKVILLDKFGKEIHNSMISLTRKNYSRVYNINYYGFPNDYFISLDEYFENDCICYFNNIKLTNFYKDGISSHLVQIKPAILTLFNIVSLQYTGIEYIAPLRQTPQRNYLIQSNVNAVGITGEEMPMLLTKLCESNFMTSVISPLNWNDLSGNAFERIQSWISYFDMGALNITGSDGALSLSLNGHNITDVGFGVSQVLPIIVQGIYMVEESVLFLEQPEIHLHPKMQMNMADFLLSVAASNRTVVVETHSDHIINRIVRRVMESIRTEHDLRNLVQIYFVSQDEGGCSRIYKDIKIDPVNGLIDCPREFFDQYGDELRVIMKQGYENLKNRE